MSFPHMFQTQKGGHSVRCWKRQNMMNMRLCNSDKINKKSAFRSGFRLISSRKTFAVAGSAVSRHIHLRSDQHIVKSVACRVLLWKTRVSTEGVSFIRTSLGIMINSSFRAKNITSKASRSWTPSWPRSWTVKNRSMIRFATSQIGSPSHDFAVFFYLWGLRFQIFTIFHIQIHRKCMKMQ